jgi:hypothetical protein
MPEVLEVHSHSGGEHGHEEHAEEEEEDHDVCLELTASPYTRCPLTHQLLTIQHNQPG